MKGTAENEETDHEVDLSSHGPTEHEEEPSHRESEFSKYATPSNLCVDREDLRLTSQTSAESLYDGDAEKLNCNTEQSCSPFPDIIVGREFYLAHGVDIAQGAEGKIETNPRDSLLYKDAAVSPGKRSDNEAWPESLQTKTPRHISMLATHSPGSCHNDSDSDHDNDQSSISSQVQLKMTRESEQVPWWIRHLTQCIVIAQLEKINHGIRYHASKAV